MDELEQVVEDVGGALEIHAGTYQNAHGATSSGAGLRIAMRNAAGTFSVSDPTAASHPAPKGYGDGLVAALEARIEALEAL